MAKTTTGGATRRTRKPPQPKPSTKKQEAQEIEVPTSIIPKIPSEVEVLEKAPEPAAEPEVPEQMPEPIKTVLKGSAPKPKKKKEFEFKDRVYRATRNYRPPNMFIKTGVDGKLLWNDPDTGMPKAIRHCPNEESIFLKEQSEFAEVEAIVFERGHLNVPKENRITQLFLEHSPEKGKIFVEVDEAAEAEKAMELHDLRTELNYFLMEAAKEKNAAAELRPVAAALKNSFSAVENLSVPELRQIISDEIDRAPHRFVNAQGKQDMFNEKTKRRYIVLRAIARGVIELSADGSAFRWGSQSGQGRQGEVIHNVTPGVKPNDSLMDYIVSNEGVLLVGELKKLIR